MNPDQIDKQTLNQALNKLKFQSGITLEQDLSFLCPICGELIYENGRWDVSHLERHGR